MKNLLLTASLFTGLVFSGNVKAQETPAAPDPNAPVMVFEKDTIDYGTIAYAADGYRYFKFTNTGKEPLIIKEAHGSCGCTVPTPPKEPIQPGQSDQIKVHYDTQRPGHFIKSVTITSNANPGSKVVYITGNIMPNPNTGTPNNPAPVAAAPVAPPIPAGTFPMKVGDKGEYVKNVQTALIKMGDATITKTGATGTFGPATQAAVKRAGYKTPLTEADYQKLMQGMKGTPAPEQVAPKADAKGKTMKSTRTNKVPASAPTK